VNFLHQWFLGIIKPTRMIDELRSKPAPFWGLWAVLIRFIITSLTTTLALYLLKRLPFSQSNLTFLSIEDYYLAEIFFLPLWGLGIWILMSSIAHLALRITHKQSNFDIILNIIGMGMLIPMPLLWLFDWIIIGLNLFTIIIAAVSHTIFQIWEASIQAIGFRKIFGLSTLGAVVLAIIINAIYILLAIIFIR